MGAPRPETWNANIAKLTRAIHATRPVAAAEEPNKSVRRQSQGVVLEVLGARRKRRPPGALSRAATRKCALVGADPHRESAVNAWSMAVTIGIRGPVADRGIRIVGSVAIGCRGLAVDPLGWVLGRERD
jgi:hypothetical protein